MVDRTWIGGSNNKADNAKDWSPNGVPQPGDALTMSASEMDITNNNLAGDVLTIAYGSLPNGATIDMDGGATVQVASDSSGGSDSLTLNVRGSNDIDILPNQPEYLDLTVNLQPKADLLMKGNMTFAGGLAINGPANSTITNDGTMALIQPNTTFNAALDGNGTVDIDGYVSIAASATVGAAVGVGQTFVMNGANMLTIDHPNQFRGTVDMLGGNPSRPAAEIDLEGLAKADSYTYQNDLLSIFSGKSVIDTLKLTDSTPNGFVVEKASGSVNIVAITDPTNPPAGLPMHT